jgi:periplasmic protein TonB
MKTSRTKQIDLERNRGMYGLVGLISALLFVIVVMEWKSYAVSFENLMKGESDPFISEVPYTFYEQNYPKKEQRPETQKVVAIDNGNGNVDDKKLNIIEIDGWDDNPNWEPEFLPEPEPEIDPILFIMVENFPIFPGCEHVKGREEQRKCFESKVNAFLMANTNYPEMARVYRSQGKVYVDFVIDANGKVTKATIARGVDKYLDQEALRVVESLPSMVPANQRGKNVPVLFTAPINFKMQ